VRAKVLLAVLRLYAKEKHGDATTDDWLDFYIGTTDGYRDVLECMIRSQLDGRSVEELIYEAWRKLLAQSKDIALRAGPGVLNRWPRGSWK